MAETGYVKIKSIKPALSGYLRKSHMLLKKSEVPEDKAVHDIRVLLKKSRAVLKLISSQDERVQNGRDIKALVLAGRLLSEIRDTSVQGKILKDLRKKYPDLFIQLTDNNEIAALTDFENKKDEELPGIKENIEKAAALIYKTGYSIRFRSMNNFDPHLLIKNLGITYDKVTGCYLAARNQPTVENIHELRKRSKDLLYQLYFFRPLNTSSVKSLEKKLDSLTSNLGRYNDLAQLIISMQYSPGNKNKAALDELAIHIREYQDVCLKKIWNTAFKLFCPGTNFINLLGFKILVI
jgi:CHAD domain-containing protein